MTIVGLTAAEKAALEEKKKAEAEKAAKPVTAWKKKGA